MMLHNTLELLHMVISSRLELPLLSVSGESQRTGKCYKVRCLRVYWAVYTPWLFEKKNRKSMKYHWLYLIKI
jgi:hypothetical protein